MEDDEELYPQLQQYCSITCWEYMTEAIWQSYAINLLGYNILWAYMF